MISKICALVAVILLATSLAGCSKKPPTCSDDDTLSLVRKIIIEQIGGSEGLSEETQDNIKIEFPRASAYDEKIKKYSCEAQLVAGTMYKLPITYESQLDDNNQHIVSVSGISIIDLFAIKAGLREGIEKNRGSKDETTSLPQQQETSTAFVVPSITGVWRGTLEGDGEMEIKATPIGFDVTLSVSTSGCAGSIDGTGSLSGKTLTLTKKDDDQICTITVKFVDDTATVDENNCSYYHGAACGFSGTLKKTK